MEKEKERKGVRVREKNLKHKLLEPIMFNYINLFIWGKTHITYSAIISLTAIMCQIWKVRTFS